jgi:hypothetical protein
MQSILVFLLAALAALTPRGCQPPPPPDPPPQAPNPISWKTDTVTATADDFFIVADGQRFDGRGVSVQVDGDPGCDGYTTLELTWFERGDEMRLNVYLKSKNGQWWSDEIRTYDGKRPFPEWLYYYGRFFDKPVGQAFEGDLNLVNNGPDDRYRGTITFKNLHFETHFGPRPCGFPIE